MINLSKILIIVKSNIINIVEIEKTIIDIRNFLNRKKSESTNLTIYNRTIDPISFIEKSKINVSLEKNKEIILQEETILELGGINQQSFLLIFPTNAINHIKNGQITLIGPEIKDIKEKSVDFGLFILIGCKKPAEGYFNNLREFSFISNSIEGFMTRTIPRRFWCRISSNIIKRFSFEFLGYAIQHLYKQKFKDIIKDIEIIMICSNNDLIIEFKEISSGLYDYINKRWNKKIEGWKKRVDCEYEWSCDTCPYIETCNLIRNALEERKKMEGD